MASREKRPLAPSTKAKQRANNDSSLLSLPSKNKKGKALSSYILETVATSSKLSANSESALPRKKVLTSLKCKKKIRPVKTNSIKVKTSRSLPVKNLKRITGQATGRSTKSNFTRTKKTKLDTEIINNTDSVPSEKTIEMQAANVKSSPKTSKKFKLTGLPESQLKSAKIHKLTTGNNKRNINNKEELESDIKYLKNRRTSPFTDIKTSKSKIDILSNKNTVDSTIDEVLAMVSDTEISGDAVENASGEKLTETKIARRKKHIFNNITILTDNEIEQENIDGDYFHKGKKLMRLFSVNLLNPKIKLSQRSLRNGKLRQLDSVKIGDGSSGESRKGGRRSNIEETITSDANAENNRKLDTASLRGSSGSELITGKKNCLKISDSTLAGGIDTIIGEHENNNNSGISRTGTDEGPILRSKTKAKSQGGHADDDNADEDEDADNNEDGDRDDSENNDDDIDNNAYDEQAEHGEDCNDVDADNNDNDDDNGDDDDHDDDNGKDNDGDQNNHDDDDGDEDGDDDDDDDHDHDQDNDQIEVIESRLEAIEDIDEMKKNETYHTINKIEMDRQSLKRRSSLNIDVKKTMGSMYGNDKTDGAAPKSQIDQMIENIKLTIAKSIESKIFGPEKALRLNKNFQVPKVEEIILPLSTKTQKINMNIDTDVENIFMKADRSNEVKLKTTLENTDKNMNNDSSSNSNSASDNTGKSDEITVPKVADTAKEIEKLVMGEEINQINSGKNIDSNDKHEASSSSIDDIQQRELRNYDCNSEKSNTIIELEEIKETHDEYNLMDKSRMEKNSNRVIVGLEKIDESTTSEQFSQGNVDEAIGDSILPSNSSMEIYPNNRMQTNDETNENNIVSINSGPSGQSSIINNPSISPTCSEKDVEVSTETVRVITTTKDSTPYHSVLNCEELSGESKDPDENSGKNAEKSHRNSLDKVEDGRRILRARDKQKKLDKIRNSEVLEHVSLKLKNEPENDSNYQSNPDDDNYIQNCRQMPEIVNTIKNEETEHQGRTRRSRDVKRRRDEIIHIQNTFKTKRNRRELKKSDQNKEEALLDNEVAKINENTQAYSADTFNKRLDGTESLRIFSEGERNLRNTGNDRSKSENDIEAMKHKTECTKRLNNKLCDNSSPKVSLSEDQFAATKIPLENLNKDSDDASTSGESIASLSMMKILETPEDKARKETILRLLGLESAEKAAERKKAKSEQCTGTLKTVIRVPKDSGKEKKRSRSPLKMVLKQGRIDGEGDSPEFYTIQKELGTSGLSDSSSGANRKFSTNHRQSCEEDAEETSSKDRQSLIIPEKSSSFSIHPGRLCADVCCYCFGKFGSLDTPMHLAQMKSDERRRKILNVERHLTKDSCLCDACYRHVDRKANTSPTNVTKPQRQHRQLMVSKCSARDCRDPARHIVKRRWLLKIKSCLQNQVNIDWESSQHTSMSFCVEHYGKIERFLTCALCKRRLARNHTHLLPASETDELNHLLPHQGVPVPVVAGTFVCKLCRYYTQLQLKYKNVENMNTNHRSFAKSYRKRILHYNNIDIDDEEDDNSCQNTLIKDKDRDKDKDKDKDKDRKNSKKSKYNQIDKSGCSTSKSLNINSTPEKSTQESIKINDDIVNYDIDESGEQRQIIEENTSNEQFLDLESAIEKLKKRKALDQHLYSTNSSVFPDNDNVDVVEILAMDKDEVTLTRLPKKQKVNNDITPVVQRLGANPSISVRTLFPGEEEMGLHTNIEFSNIREITPQGWEKCATIIQYDRDTKLLWQELQRPYGNQSSFLRHLILLEKYYRSGDLVLAPNASRNAINYSTSVQNRLISYEGPEKMDEPITESMPTEFNNSKRLSGGYVMERDRQLTPLPSQSSSINNNIPLTPIMPVSSVISTLPTTSTPSKIISCTNTPMKQTSKSSPTKILKMNSGVSIIKKPPPNLQRLNLSSTGCSISGGSTTSNGNGKRKDALLNKITPTGTSGGKVFQLSEPDFKRLQTLKKQKIINEKLSNTNNMKLNSIQYQKAQIAAQTQFQKHLRMQQEMLNRQSRGDFEPLICDVRSLANENTPAQNLLNNLTLPKSIQVTTKPSSTNPIPILPKIPKSLTVIPQTVSRPVDK